MAAYSNRLEFSHRRHAKQQRLRVLAFLTTFALVVAVIGIVVTIGAFAFFARDLPSPDKLSSREQEEALSTKIYDRNGQLLFDVYNDTNRQLVTIDQIPKYLQEATVSTEDKNFYTNSGFDLAGILRIPYNLIVNHQLTGGSTLTQQLVKNTLLTPERTIVRKFKEFFLAVQVDNKFSKAQILQMYLNEAPYGGTAIGVEAASEQYFGKHVKDLDLAECAILAGLPQEPTYYSPLGNYPNAYKDRTAYVLRRMEEDKYITADQEKQTLAEINSGQVKFAANDISIQAPHFVMYVKELLEQEFGQKLVEEGGLRVTTTLDLNMQNVAQQSVTNEIAKLKAYKVANGAVVVMDPKTGDILAMVGGKDYNGKSEPDGCNPGQNCTFEGNVNTALALRQPGSSTKPITYSVAFQKGYSPASVIMDVPTTFPQGPGQSDYSPTNYDNKWHGPVAIRYALGNSYNMPAVKTLARVGVPDVMQLAYDMGITNWQPTPDNLKSVGLSLVLGGRELTLLQLVNAYSVFADQGVKHDPVAILKVTDNSGNKVYFEEKHDSQKQVLSQQIAFLISHILSDNSARTAEFGPNSSLVIPNRTVAAKTGTTDSKKDNWTVGYTPSLTVGVWVGNDDGEIMDPRISSGITGATPIWNDITSKLIKNMPKEDFSKVPDGVIATQVDALTGGLPHGSDPVRSDYFIKGTEPKSVSPFYQQFNVCTGKPTNYGSSDDVSAGKTTPQNLVAFQEADPISTDGKNRWQDGINTWDFNQPNGLLKAPYIQGCDATSPKALTVQISNVPDGANVTKSFDIAVGANSQGFTVLKITGYLDDKEIGETTSQPYGFHINLPDNGTHTVRVDGVDSGGNTDSTQIMVHGTL